jgi:hypothetical protein
MAINTTTKDIYKAGSGPTIRVVEKLRTIDDDAPFLLYDVVLVGTGREADQRVTLYRANNRTEAIQVATKTAESLGYGSLVETA